MGISKQAWVVRANPHHISRIKEFLQGDLVALGWPHLGDLTGMDLDQIKGLLKRTNGYKNYDSRERGASGGLLDTFVNRVSDEDYVLVPSPEDGAVYIGQFRGGYRYARSKDNEKEGYPHHRKVKWILGKSRIPRHTFPPTVVSSLKAHQPIFSTDASAVSSVVERFRVRKEALVPEADDFDTDQHADEGAPIQVLTLQANRSRGLRELKIRQALASGGGRLICEVKGCGFDFEAQYGQIGKGFAHIHHRHSLSSRTGRRTTYLSELAIICANCHAMIHRHGKCRSLETLIPTQNASRSES